MTVRQKQTALKKPAKRQRQLPESVTQETKPEQENEGLDNIDLLSIRQLAMTLTLMAHFAQGNRMPDKHKDEILDFVRDTIPILTKLELPEDLFVNVFSEIVDESTVERTEEDLQDFMQFVFSFQKNLQNNPNMPPLMLEILNDTRLMANGSESATKRVHDKIGIFKSPLITSLFKGNLKADPQAAMLTGIKDLVVKLGGEGEFSPYWLDVKEATEARKKALKDPDTEHDYKLYLQYRREALAETKKFIQGFVRANANDQGLVNYKKLMKALKEYKVHVHTMPKGFKGMVDDQMQLYTTAGKAIEGKPGGGRAYMNDNYDPEADNAYVFKAYVPGSVTRTSYYTKEHKAKSTSKKFANVDELASNIKKTRKKWRKRIKAGGDRFDTDYLAAMLLEIMYQSQARIGAVSNKTMNKDGKYVKTFGISTIAFKNVRKTSQGINILYQGKALGKQKHVLTKNSSKAMKIVIKNILEWKEQSKPNEPVFQTSRGKPISGQYVTNLLRKLGGGDYAKSHHMRHLKGMYMMSEIVEKNPWRKPNKTADSSNQVTKWLKSKAMAIGKQLGHFSGDKVTPNTAIKNYCPPPLMLSLYKDGSVPVPKTMAKIAGIDPMTLEGLGMEQSDE